jgi:cysteine-rich repeat protein
MRQVRRGSHVRTRSLGIAWGVAIAAIAAVAATGACLLNTKTTLCEDSGLICPAGWRCAAAQDVCIPSGGCGDGIKSPDEVCDDGNVLPGDSCSPDCQSDKPCGDGVVDPGENCDAGVSDTKGCDKDCTFVECGDGYVNKAAGEECDTHGMVTSECNGPLCKLPTCGDSFYNPEFVPPGGVSKEQCDTGGNTQACDGDCTVPACGDGYTNSMYTVPGTNSNEQCDAGKLINGMPVPADSSTCDKDCTLAECGDMYVNPNFIPAGASTGEECDNGTGNSDTAKDACRTNCHNHFCGDNVTDTDEDCDDGNSVNTDNCTSKPGAVCKVAFCGDGFVKSGAEQCDDANTDNTDACTSKPGALCRSAFCGDGFVRSGVEGCDPPGSSCGGAKVCGADCQCP